MSFCTKAVNRISCYLIISSMFSKIFCIYDIHWKLIYLPMDKKCLIQKLLTTFTTGKAFLIFVPIHLYWYGSQSSPFYGISFLLLVACLYMSPCQSVKPSPTGLLFCNWYVGLLTLYLPRSSLTVIPHNHFYFTDIMFLHLGKGCYITAVGFKPHRGHYMHWVGKCHLWFNGLPWTCSGVSSTI